MTVILKMMEVAQQRNTQPQSTIPHANGSVKPVIHTVEAVLEMMAMAQQRQQPSSLE